LKHITVLTTGGTIAMRADANAGGAVPVLVGADLVAGLPRGLADVRVEAFSNLPSAHFTLDHIWNLSRRIAALVADEAIDGVVVTHGTDTFDESAYLSDLTINTPKPIVFTGAMRTASEVGYEGLANLSAAIQVAASDAARDLGVLVVFNDEIHAARDVTKTHTTALATFASLEFGILGRVYPDGVFISRKPMQREFVPAPRLETNVHLLTLAVGMSDALLEYFYDTVGARGVVLETLGGGRVPPWWLPTIERAIKAGTAIVIASRVSMGRTIDRYGYSGAHRDLANLGCWFADGLSGPKARIKLMATLAMSDPGKFWRTREHSQR
jgi:L-asparaginase